MKHLPKQALKWISRGGLLVLGFGIAAVLAEIIVRGWAPQDLSGSWRVETPDGLVMNKSSGQSQHVSDQRRITYEFSSPGLRGAAPSNTDYRVLVLGDSFTFGWLLHEQDSFVGRLQQYTDNHFGKEAIAYANAACGGWGLDEMVAYIESFGNEVAPHLVLVFINTDDVGRCLKSPRYERASSDRSKLQRMKTPLSRTKTWAQAFPGYQFLLEHSHLVQMMRQIAVWGVASPEADEPTISGIPWHLYRGPKSNFLEDPYPAVRLAQALFVRLQDWCLNRSVPLVVFTTGWHSATDGPPSREPTEAFMESAATFFANQSVPFYDLTPQIRPLLDADPTAFHLPENAHPNERGAALIAEHAWPFLLPNLESLTEN